MAYLKGQGVSGQIAKRYGLGYARRGLAQPGQRLSRIRQPVAETNLGLEIVGGRRGKRYDRFRDRIMFPSATSGRVHRLWRAGAGRRKPKYLNSPKRRCSTRAANCTACSRRAGAIRSEAGYALVTEGYMDVVAWHSSALVTPWPRWHGLHRRARAKLFRFTDQVVLQLRRRRGGAAPRQRRWTAPCPTPAIRAPSSSVPAARARP